MHQSRPSLDDSSSAVSYRDNLEDEPFDEKVPSYQYDTDEDDGVSEELPMERRRVGQSRRCRAFELIQMCQ